MSDFIPPVAVHVMTVELQRPAVETVSDTDKGQRQYVEFTKGTFEILAKDAPTFSAPRITGVLSSGAAMNVIHSDRLFSLDGRYVLRTDEGHLIYVQAIGRRFGAPDVSDRLRKGLPVKRSEYYGVSAITIETNAPGLEWMNYHQFLGNATSRPDADVVRISAVTFVEG